MKPSGCVNTADPWYRVLGIEPGVPMKAVKDAYHRAAKKNHPDLFPEAERRRRQLSMMRINEAYLRIVSADTDTPRFSPDAGSSAPAGEEPPAPDAPRSSVAGSQPFHTGRELGFHRDPAYVYYKLGLNWYNKGREKFFERYEVTNERVRYLLDNRVILGLAVSCLRLFRASYECFSRVVDEYPQSIWMRDAKTKLYYIDRYNAIYQRICRSIAAQMGRH